MAQAPDPVWTIGQIVEAPGARGSKNQAARYPAMVTEALDKGGGRFEYRVVLVGRAEAFVVTARELCELFCLGSGLNQPAVLTPRASLARDATCALLSRRGNRRTLCSRRTLCTRSYCSLRRFLSTLPRLLPRPLRTLFLRCCARLRLRLNLHLRPSHRIGCKPAAPLPR